MSFCALGLPFSWAHHPHSLLQQPSLFRPTSPPLGGCVHGFFLFLCCGFPEGEVRFSIARMSLFSFGCCESCCFFRFPLIFFPQRENCSKLRAQSLFRLRVFFCRRRFFLPCGFWAQGSAPHPERVVFTKSFAAADLESPFFQDPLPCPYIFLAWTL